MSRPSPKPCTALRSSAEYIMPHTSSSPVRDQRVKVFIASDPSGHQPKRNEYIPSYFCCLTKAELSQLAQGQSLMTGAEFGHKRRIFMHKHDGNQGARKKQHPPRTSSLSNLLHGGGVHSHDFQLHLSCAAILYFCSILPSL